MQRFEPIEVASCWPFSSWMSAMTTNEPWLAKRRDVASPIPLAPPVIMDIFPASFRLGVFIVISAAIFVAELMYFSSFKYYY